MKAKQPGFNYNLKQTLMNALHSHIRRLKELGNPVVKKRQNTKQGFEPVTKHKKKSTILMLPEYFNSKQLELFLNRKELKRMKF